MPRSNGLGGGEGWGLDERKEENERVDMKKLLLRLTSREICIPQLPLGLNEVISIDILTCSLVVMSTVRQGVVLQRSCYYLVVPHDVCRGDHYILLSHLSVFLQSEVSVCLRRDNIFLDLPSFCVYFHPRRGWFCERVWQRENGC